MKERKCKSKVSSNPKPNPLVQSFELILESRLGGVAINFVLIPLLVLSALLLPPVSLADRLLSIGYSASAVMAGPFKTPTVAKLRFLKKV